MRRAPDSLTYSLVLAGLLALSSPGQAAGSSVATAAESDPKRMGWMQGHPPAPERVIGQPDSNYFSFPKMRWTVCHFRELLPTRNIDRGPGAARVMTYALDDGIDDVTFTPLGSDESMTWEESLSANYTDGILVIHQGRIVYERYAGCLGERGKHGAMSMTKSMTGLLAEILVAEGKLDERARVSTIIPELASSAFGDATVRQVMDMTTALDFSEDYSDPEAGIWTYSAAANPLPKPAGYTGPIGYYAYLQSVGKQGTHGEAFGYKTINTDVLGWIIARNSGKAVPDLLSERIWARMGAEQDAYITVDALGTPFAGGGLSAGLRDLGRIGMLMLNDGLSGEERLFPAAAVASIREGGDPAAFEAAGYKTMPGGSYRGMWWVFHNAHGAFAARGVHGQTIYVDPTADMVLVRFASHPRAKNAYIDPTSLPAYQAVAEYLLDKGADSALAGQWRITMLAGAGPLDDAAYEANITPEGRWTFAVGCNRLSAAPTVEDGGVRFGPVAATRMACAPDVARLERQLVEALEASRTFEAAGQRGRLVLQDGAGDPVVVLTREGP